jgi:hypothetical protein
MSEKGGSVMDANVLKRLLDESCDELSRILDECRSGPAENVRVVEVMEPLLQEFRDLKDQVFYDAEQDERR